MNINNKTAKEIKEKQIASITTLADGLDKGKWFTVDSLTKMNCADRQILLESLQAEKQFLSDFCGGNELILEEI
jgi:hypothetical protein